MFMRVSFLTGCIQHRPSERHLAAGRHDSHWHKGHRQGKSTCQARGNSMAKVSGQTQSSCSVYIRGKPGKTLGAEAPPKKKSLSHQTCTIQLSAKYKNWCVLKNIFFSKGRAGCLCQMPQGMTPSASTSHSPSSQPPGELTGCPWPCSSQSTTMCSGKHLLRCVKPKLSYLSFTGWVWVYLPAQTAIGQQSSLGLEQGECK